MLLHLKASHPEEVEKIIANLKNSKSTGLDYIDTSVIKLASQELIPSITHIINLAIRDKCFPASWKKSKVVPLSYRCMTRACQFLEKLNSEKRVMVK